MNFDFYCVMYRSNEFSDWQRCYYSSIDSASNFVVDNLILYGIDYKVLGFTDVSDDI